MSSPAVPAVRIDPATGQKLFNTRAAKASARIVGKGYDVLDAPELVSIPEARRDITFDAEAQAQQREFIESRRGTDDYMQMEGPFARYLEDHYSTEPIEREALTDECDVVVVGAGFSGLLLWYKLSKAGFTDIRFCERGGDVGGTWYWNRYPGIACDVESYAYMLLLDETGYFPTQKYASGFEIFEYCQLIAEKFGFYDHCLFHTEVTGVNWDDDAQRWTVRTARGDAMRARFVMLANGILTTPAAGSHRGHGDLRRPVVPHVPVGLQRRPGRQEGRDHRHRRHRRAGHPRVGEGGRPPLRLPAHAVHDRGARPAQHQARPDRALEAATGLGGRPPRPGRRDPRWSRRPADRRQRGRRAAAPSDRPRLSREERTKKQLDKGYRIMQQIRDRIDAVVEDPETAAALKPYYAYACKRPTFHDEYLPTFNRPNVTLVDVAPIGVQLINERGVVHDGVQYDLDVLIYATGFDFMSRENVGRVTGSDGRSIADKWLEQGTRTFLGLHTAGFPNLLILAGPQSGGGKFNFAETIEEQTDYVVWLLSTMRENGHHAVDVREDDEADWAQHCAEADRATAPLRDCLGNFNGYGRTEPGSLAYFGGRESERRQAWAQETLQPYVFTTAP